VQGAVRQKTRRVIVDHVKVAWGAVWIWMIWKRSKIVAYWLDARPGRIAAFGEVPVEAQINRVDIVRSGLWVRIGNYAGGRGFGRALALAPEESGAKGEHGVGCARAAHYALMEVFADGVLCRERLQNGGA